MTGQIDDLENEMTIAWEQIAQIIQKALSYHNVRRYIQAERELVPEYLPATVQFGSHHFTVQQETQSELLVLRTLHIKKYYF